MDSMDEAKAIFQKYLGNHYEMYRDEVYDQYCKYHVPKQTEEEWRQEILQGFRKIMESSSNKKELTRCLQKYVFTVESANMLGEFDYLFSYVKRNIDRMDTYSSFLWCSVIYNLLLVRGSEAQKQAAKKQLIDFYQDLCEQPITISEDYAEEGQFPDYLTEEWLRMKIQDNIAWLQGKK